MASRRSPRIIEHLCNGMIFPEMCMRHTAVLLSLAHCSGWSADRIRLKMKGLARKPPRAEEIYDFYLNWVSWRSGSEEVTAVDADMMQLVMRESHISLPTQGRSLDKTAPPKSLSLIGMWYQQVDDSCAYYDHFSPRERSRRIRWLSNQKMTLYNSIGVSESAAMESLGPHMAWIIERTLREWHNALRVKLRRDPGLRLLNEQRYVDLNTEYLQVFKRNFELVFGLMEEYVPYSLEDMVVNPMLVPYTSAGLAGILLFASMITDRIRAIEAIGEDKREEIGVQEVAEAELDADSKSCSICQEPMCVENSDGIIEKPIKLVICCGQVFGDHCIKSWVKNVASKCPPTCPVCRFRFPSSFVQKLVGTKEDDEVDNEEYALSIPVFYERAAQSKRDLRQLLVSFGAIEIAAKRGVCTNAHPVTGYRSL